MTDNLATIITVNPGEECSVCLEEIGTKDKAYLEECGHSFHVKCLKRWMNNSSVNMPTYLCPLCRRPVSRPEELEYIKKEKNIMTITRFVCGLLMIRLVVAFMGIVIVGLIVIFVSKTSK